jgi:hypothetical protein
MTSWTESTVVGKQMMIKYIVEARNQAITAHNIKVGWRAAGLWSVHMAKPLMSRLLMENSNKVVNNDDLLHPLQSPRRKTDLRDNLAIRKQDLDTPAFVQEG